MRDFLWDLFMHIMELRLKVTKIRESHTALSYKVAMVQNLGHFKWNGSDTTYMVFMVSRNVKAFG